MINTIYIPELPTRDNRKKWPHVIETILYDIKNSNNNDECTMDLLIESLENSAKCCCIDKEITAYEYNLLCDFINRIEYSF